MADPDAGFPEFRPRLPWWSGDLQTCRNQVAGRPVDLSEFHSRRLRLPTSDGSGDCQQAVLSFPAAGARRLPLLLLHGLTGSEDSYYLRASARHFLRHGHPVLRVNLRGAGPSGTACRVRYCAGSSRDLADVINHLPAGLAEGGVLVMGYSLGANILLKFLGEPATVRTPVRAAVAVSAPIDLGATCRNILRPRNLGYHRWFLAHMKAESLAPGVPLDARARTAIARARTIYEYDDRFVAPSHGYAGADDFYRRCSAKAFLDGIEVPTLVIAAQDDPVVPFAPYRDLDWRRAPSVTRLFPPAGGHVGFHGRASRTPWHDRCALQWFRRWQAVPATARSGSGAGPARGPRREPPG